jgi:hypothetical protein
MNQKLLAVISTFVALLAATHVHAQSKDLTRLRVSYSSIGAASWSTWVAKDVGIFQKFGLDVGLIYIGGGPRAMSTTIANETQITQGAGTGSIIGKARRRRHRYDRIDSGHHPAKSEWLFLRFARPKI